MIDNVKEYVDDRLDKSNTFHCRGSISQSVLSTFGAAGARAIGTRIHGY